MQHPRRPRDRAFTLVELMAALAVMAVLGSIAVTRSHKNDGEASVTGLTRQVSALVQQARFTARSSGRQVRLTFNPQNPVAQLRVAATPGDAAVNWAGLQPQLELSAEPGAQILAVQSGATLGAVMPGSMMGSPVSLTFLSSGRVYFDNSTTTYGGTLFVTDQALKVVQRILVYGRTGFPKVITQ